MPESLEQLLQRVTQQQDQIAQARPLPEATLRSLLDDFLIRFAHDTTALEGNTLTLHETQVVLEHGITIGGKTLREHLEVTNVAKAWEALNAWVRSAEPLTEELLIHLHRLTMAGILPEEAGHYRTVPVFIRGSQHVPLTRCVSPRPWKILCKNLHIGPQGCIRLSLLPMHIFSWRPFIRLSMGMAACRGFSSTAYCSERGILQHPIQPRLAQNILRP